MRRFEKSLPWAAVALVVVWVAASWHAPRAQGGFDEYGFGSLPVLHEGRLKPLDTVARSSLLMIRSKQSVQTGEGRLDATRWFLDMAARPEVADKYKVFVIDDPDVLGLLGIERTGRYYCMNDLRAHLDDIDAQATRADQVESNRRTRFQRAVVALRDRLIVYQRLENTLQPASTDDFPAEVAKFKELAPTGKQALDAHQQGGGGNFGNDAMSDFATLVQRYRFLADAGYFMALPPMEGSSAPEDWRSVGAALVEYLDTSRMHPGVDAYAAMLKAYRDGDAAGFNRALGGYRTTLAGALPRSMKKVGEEARFNLVEPFSKGMVIYVAALLATFISWIAWGEALGSTAFWLVCAAYVLHTTGLATRIFLQGRPPVTNLYSSAVFVGWAAVGIGLVLERLYRRGIGTATAATAGFATLIVAHHLAATGDTMEMMRAVLNSNFWLSTHVVCITLGYSGAFLAGFLAILFIFRGIFTRAQDAGATRDLERMIYGVLCFTIIFSFVGTVLGGIWADQSWGRFWGWDPKENGALLIVLWTAIALHARVARYAGARGLALFAVGGNIVTSFSWFGVNMLGVGLHSYGFMEGAFLALSIFIASQLGIILLGSLPVRYWRSSPVPRNGAAGLAPAKRPAGARPAPASPQPAGRGAGG